VTFIAALAGSASNSTSTINDVEPGVLGFLVVAALAVALVFLLRSMNKQFKKIGPAPEDPPEESADGAQPDAGAQPDGALDGSTAAKRR
jgi:hypothetical protein